MSLPKLYFMAFIWCLPPICVSSLPLTLERQALRHSQSTENKERPDYTTDCELVNQVDLGKTGDFGESGGSDWASVQFEPVLVNFQGVNPVVKS